MKIIHPSIKGDVMDAPIGQAVATTRGIAGLNTVLYPALLIGLAVCAFLAGDLPICPTLTEPLALRAWVECGTQLVVASIVEAATLAHGHAGVTTEHKARITDTALTAGGFTALWGQEAWATHRAGITTELVVTVGRTLEGCGDRARESQAEAVVAADGPVCKSLPETSRCCWIAMGLDVGHMTGALIWELRCGG